MKKIKKALIVLFIIAALSSLLSCDLLIDVIFRETEEEETAEWTVMVWLDGDNNLNEAAVIDFHEMEHGLYLAQQSDSDITDKLSIIVQYDQNPTHDNSSSVPGRYEVLPNATENSQYVAPSSTSTLLESLTEPNMGSAEELADFIDYAKEYYPAQHYALILWNHGGGVRSAEEEGELTKAICWDDTDGDDALYIGEIKDYLDSSHSVDFLGMDACLMGFVEVAYEFRPDTGDFGSDAITFSPASEQGDGWEYDAIFSRLSGQSGSDSDGHSYYSIDTLSANQFATVAAQEYEDAWSSDSWETQTAVDLTQIADVKSAADDFAGTIKDYQTQVENIRGAVGTGRLMAYFDESETSEWYSYAGFDLYELAEQVKANSEVTSIDNAADDLMDAIDDAVLYSFAQSSYDAYGTGFEEGKNGLAIFFPDGDEDYGSYPYWAYQHWYNGVSHSEYASWWGSPDSPDYGALDFCTSDGDGTVESWFELLQYWFNDSDDDPNPYNPSPKE
ncbi:MAG: clostripain-related cysteine peptidase [Spirochaetaceae bacterium JB067]